MVNFALSVATIGEPCLAMSAFSETIRYDLITMIEEDPVSFTFGGSVYTGAFSGITRRRPLEIGGFEPMPEATVVVNLKNAVGDDVFTTARPTEGDRITIDDVEYRVDRTEVDSIEECLQMDLRSVHK